MSSTQIFVLWFSPDCILESSGEHFVKIRMSQLHPDQLIRVSGGGTRAPYLLKSSLGNSNLQVGLRTSDLVNGEQAPGCS